MLEGGRSAEKSGTEAWPQRTCLEVADAGFRKITKILEHHPEADPFIPDANGWCALETIGSGGCTCLAYQMSNHYAVRELAW